MNEQNEYKGKPEKGPIIWLAVTTMLFIAIACILSFIKSGISHDENEQAVEATSTPYIPTDNYVSDYDYEDDYGDDYDYEDDYEDEDEPFTAKYKARLSCGSYYVGYNIPKGTYNLKLVSGSGNAQSNELNEIFGTNKKYGYIKKYSNLELEEDDCLRIGGNLVLQISSSDAEIKNKLYTNTTNKAKRTYRFSSGKYKCKKHIKEGIYDVSLVSGSGNVFISDNVNEVFGSNKSYGQIKKVKNVVISKGDEIEISGCSVKFTPSKIKFEKNLY